MKLNEVRVFTPDGELSPGQVAADAAQHQINVIKHTLQSLEKKHPDLIFVDYTSYKVIGFKRVPLKTHNANLDFTIHVEKHNVKLLAYAKKLVSRLTRLYDIIAKHYARAPK